jgi:hypothetical protein
MAQRRYGRSGGKLLKLWMLEPEARFKETMDEDSDENKWNPWNWAGGCAVKLLIRAYTEEDARAFAQQAAGDEQDHAPEGVQVWLSPQYTSCVEVMKYGTLGVVLRQRLPD